MPLLDVVLSFEYLDVLSEEAINGLDESLRLSVVNNHLNVYFFIGIKQKLGELRPNLDVVRGREAAATSLVFYV